MSKYSLKQYIEEADDGNFIDNKKFLDAAKDLKWSCFPNLVKNEINVFPKPEFVDFFIDDKKYSVNVGIFYTLKFNENNTQLKYIKYESINTFIILIWGKGKYGVYSNRLGLYNAINYNSIEFGSEKRKELSVDYEKSDLDEHMIDAFASHFINEGIEKIKELVKKVSPNFDLNLLEESFEEGMEVKGILRVSTIANGFRPPAKKLGQNLYELSDLTIKVERRPIKIDDETYIYGGTIVVSMVIEIKNLADLNKYIRLKPSEMRDFCNKYVHLCGVIHNWGTTLPTFDGYLMPDEIKIHEIRITQISSSNIYKIVDDSYNPPTYQPAYKSGSYERETFTRSDLIDPSLAEALTSHMTEEGLNQFKDKISDILTDKQYDIVPEELKK
ncbi:MAG: hypothetical protein EBQ92_00360 [Proteobacteria bacterium]|nr:hypothetical protein [Pseudomonadota bacterium]